MPKSCKRTILIVDDIKVIREQICAHFSDIGWDAIKASDGKEALCLLEKRNWSCNCIILDKKMPKMDGLTFLRTLRQKEHGNPPIPVIVLSAYVSDEADKTSFQKLGAARVFQKPEEMDLLASVAEVILSPINQGKTDIEINHAISAYIIDNKVKNHEDIIEVYYTSNISEQNFVFKNVKEPLFVVARRWNSWYPSFFDVPGGAYAMVFPVCKERHRNRVVVVDPGFRFLKILREFGISVKDVETCIVTHNHPDHIGGVFEYIACRYQANAPASFLCNPSTRRMLGEMAQANVTSKILPENNKEELVIDYTDKRGAFRSLSVRSFATNHGEVGWDSDSRGLVLSCNKGKTKGVVDSSCQTVILGDSIYDHGNPAMDFPFILAGDMKTKISVLHIGSAQIKQRAGGHLYLTGLARLVQQMAVELEKHGRSNNDKLVVLVSEWGLEHASASQMRAICPSVNGFDNASAIVSTIEFLRNNLKELGYDNMDILPADIGLTIGMESGLVYLKSANGKVNRVSADQVTFTPTKDGLQYS